MRSVVEECAKLAICCLAYYVYQYILPIRINFRVKSEYYLLLLRETLIFIYFVIIYCIFRGYGCAIACIYSLSATVFYIISILLLKRELPVILHIKSSNSAAMPNITITNTIIIKRNEDINESALQTVIKNLKPDGIVMHDISVNNLKCVIKNRLNAKILIQNVNNNIRSLMLMDFFSCIGSVSAKVSYNVGIVSNDVHLYQAMSDELSEHGVACSEIKLCTQSHANVDYILVTNLLTNPTADDYQNILNLIEMHSHANIPVMLLTPIMASSANTSKAINKYELMAQKYANTRIIRMSYIVYEGKNLVPHADHNLWQHVSQIAQYILHVMGSITDNQQYVYHYVHGEAISSNHITQMKQCVQELQ